MRKSTRFLSLLLGFFCAVTSWADVPFETTTITDGEFAIGTKWYTMKLGASALVISDNEDASYISLSTSETSLSDADLWCFVGDDTNGYQVYNKQAGADKVLASPTTMTGTTGATSYVVLKSTSDLTDYTALWAFESSDDIDYVDGYYMYQLGTSANKVNNRNNILAFWTGGADAGSTLQIDFAAVTYQVSLEYGTMSSSGSSSYYSTWTSTATDPLLTLDAGANNMLTQDNDIVVYRGRINTAQDYTLSTTSGYYISDISYDYAIAATATTGNTFTVDGVTYTAADTAQSISLTGLEEITAVPFTITGTNATEYGIVFSNFLVTIKVAETSEAQTDLFVTSSTQTVPYRIPAIAKAYNGDLVAISDYRYCGSDIGYGRVDLVGRISSDNGVTWGDEFLIANGSEYTDTESFMHTGFGDAALVADRESPTLLMLSCTGAVPYGSATRTNHQGIARFYSYDNGATWTTPVDISETIYTMFDTSAIGTPRSMFVGSGRIFQSSTVKVGEYYRIYCSVLYKDVNSVEKNYVLYSDDFGATWGVLGGIDVAPIPSGANEPKVEELPDGSIVVSSRCTGGRYYNIFNFTDSEAATGSWGTMSFSGSSNDGVTATSNSCNGEIMILPARRVSDGKGVYVALQSLPFGSGRTNVGIYYKELETLADFDTPANFAADWDGRHQASYMGSAYSTMALQADSTIGFLYEESTHGYDYTIVYKNYSLAYITDSAYVYDPTVIADSLVINGIEDKYETISGYFGTNVGNLVADSETDVTAAYNAYVAAPSKANYEAFNAAVLGAERIELDANMIYRIRNTYRSSGTLYLVASSSALSSATLNTNSEYQLFAFVAAGTNTWYIYNLGAEVYVGQTPAVYNSIGVSSTADYAYTVTSAYDGRSYFSCTDPSNSSYPAIHLNSSGGLVPWTTSSEEGSLWYIEPTGIATAVEQVKAEAAAADATPEVFYDLSGRQVSKPEKGVYTTSKRRKVYVK